MTTPSLAELIRCALDSRLMDVHTALIARVESYDAARQTVAVKPQLKRAINTSDGRTLSESLPIIPDVPVLFPRAGGYFISFPIKSGDFVQLLFNERSIAEWLEQGKESESSHASRHSFDGAVAIPGIYPYQQALNAHQEHMVLGSAEGPQIHLTADEIRLGSEQCSDAVALASKVLAELSTIAQAFNIHFHPHPWGPTQPPTIPLSAPNSVASTKVKII